MVVALPLTFRDATDDDAVVVSELVNTAYREGDAWYKRPECVERMDKDGTTARELIASDHLGCIIVAEQYQEDPEQAPTLVGAVHCQWLEGDLGTLPGFPDTTKLFYFGMLSVPQRYGGKGIGKRLTGAAIERLELEAHAWQREQSQEVSAVQCGRPSSNTWCPPCSIQIDVVTSLGPRKNCLVGFYSAFGFEALGSETPAWWEVFGVVADEYMGGKVMVQRMQKHIVPAAATKTTC